MKKEPPAAPRSIATTAKPFLTLVLILLYAVNKCLSIDWENSSDFSFNNCSSFSVSFKIASNSPFLWAKCASCLANFSLVLSITSFFWAILALYSLILFSDNWISSSWYSISLDKESNSRLLRTFFCCSSYLVIKFLDSSIANFLLLMSVSKFLTSSAKLESLLFNPATSSSKSSTSKGNSPRTFLISSILESINCKSYNALNFSSTVTSFLPSVKYSVLDLYSFRLK